MKFVALIPIRGGSKGIPRKNIRNIAGKPLFVWSTEAAHKSQIFDSIYISSDCEETLQLAKAHTPYVKTVKRSHQLALDTTSSEAVMLDFIEGIDCDVLALVQVTSPLTRSSDFQAAKEKFLKTQADSLLTVVESKSFYWSHDGRPINYDPSHRPRRQDFAGLLMENGAFYFTKKATLQNTQSRLGGKIVLHTMDSRTGYEIDEPDDWKVVETMLEGIGESGTRG